MKDKLTHDNFLLYCAKYYDGTQCHTTKEFEEDINRIKYIKKLITRYIENGDLKERIILNHIIILNNMFGPVHVNRILYLKLKEQFKYVKPFLLLLNIMQKKLYNINEENIIYMDDISMDLNIIKALREINND